MGITTKKVEIELNGNNMKYYENLDYEIPRRKNKWGRTGVPKGTKILIKVEDLPNSSNVFVDIECDNCGKELKNIRWQDYNKCLKDGKYYCNKCSKELYGGENSRKAKLKNGISFKAWCVENNRQDVLDRWDYILNDLKPQEVNKNTHRKFYFKCPRGLHESELKGIGDLTHGKQSNIDCHMCNSFAQWGLDNIGNDFFEKYWDYDKNKNINPWKISYACHDFIFIKCQEKDYHGSYKVNCRHFTINNSRCPFCASTKVHPLDSLGQLLSDKGLSHLWSKRNKKSPFLYSPYSMKEVYWKCPKGKHKEYSRAISSSTVFDFRCPECSKERDESLYQQQARLYLNELGYDVLHERNCTITPTNPKTKMLLPYDNEIVVSNIHLIIEVMGEQHENICLFHILSTEKRNTTPEQELHYQKVKDRYKRIYAKSHNYEYLAVWYYHFDKQETWKQLIDEKIQSILHK